MNGTWASTSGRSNAQWAEGLAFTIPGPKKTRSPVLGSEARSLWAIRRSAREVFRLVKRICRARGGNLVFQDASPQDLDGYSKSHDLFAGGRRHGELTRMFERDSTRSPFDKPMRALALILRQEHGATHTLYRCLLQLGAGRGVSILFSRRSLPPVHVKSWSSKAFPVVHGLLERR